METSTPVGERIAYYRRRRGLSQVKLAGLLGRSESWVSQVERGARQIDRVSILLKVAAALDVPVTKLTPESLVCKAPEQHPTVRAVRLLLCRPDALRCMFASISGGESKAPSHLEELESRTGHAWELTHASRYGELAELLPALIPEAEALAHDLSASRQQRAFGLVSAIYQATTAVMAKLQATDVGWVVAERSIVAARRARAPLHFAAGYFRLAHVFLGGNQSALALETCRAAAVVLEPQVADGSPELLSLWGALNLAGAVAAIRARQEDVARDCMRDAEGAARKARYRPQRLPHRVRAYQRRRACRLPGPRARRRR